MTIRITGVVVLGAITVAAVWPFIERAAAAIALFSYASGGFR
jgi:hypothetical protein